MATGLKLRIKNTANDQTVDRTFTQFPVRIGRNTLNDLCIVDRFVSQFHAVVELRGTELMLRDLGSSNGTKLSGTRAPAHELTSLEGHKNAFSIGPLEIQALVAEVEVDPYEDHGPQSLGDAGTGDDERVLDDSFITNINETLAFNDPKMAAARAQFAASEGTSIPPAAGNPPNLQSTLLLDQNDVARQKAAVMARIAAAQQAAAGSSGAPPANLSPSEAKQRRLEQLALQGVREIAYSLLGSARALDDPDDLVRFLTKLRDTLEVFLRAFIPLRDGYRQFASQLHIQRGKEGSSERRVDTAQDERELAAALLDWSQKGREAHKAIEGTFADLMIHQLALLHAIMRGVKSLLDTLSPKSMDAALEAMKKQGKTNFMWGPWRFQELWRVYQAKHGDMDDGDKRMFAALFGSDFAESYNQYRTMVDTPES